MNRADAPTFAVYHRWKAYVAIALLGLPLTVAAIAWPTVLTMVPIFAMGGLVLLGIYTDDPTPRAISEVSDPHWDLYFESALVDELNTHARKAAALPMTGQAPDWSDGMPADALRRAGLTYLERATASQ